MRASRSKRASRSASVANACGRTLIATSRPSLVSRARYTSPIPPHADPFVDEIHAEPTPGHAGAGRLAHRLRDRRWRQAFEPFRRRGLIEQRLHLALQ